MPDLDPALAACVQLRLSGPHLARRPSPTAADGVRVLHAPPRRNDRRRARPQWRSPWRGSSPAVWLGEWAASIVAVGGLTMLLLSGTRVGWSKCTGTVRRRLGPG